MRRIATLVVLVAGFALAVDAPQALAWPAPVPGQSVCIPNLDAQGKPDGTFTIGTAGATSPAGSHQPENGTCEGPVKPPVATTPVPPPTPTTPAPPVTPAPAPVVPPTPQEAAPVEQPAVVAPAPAVETPTDVVEAKASKAPEHHAKPKTVVHELTQPITRHAVATPVAAPAQLPFTGPNVFLIAALGLGALAGGFTLRRHSRSA